MLDFRRAFAVLSLILLLQVPSFATDARVQAMGDDFVSRLPADWDAVRGDWAYFDAVGCFTSGQNCYANNPASPYGYPTFGNPGPYSPLQMGPSEAVVIFLRTPPEMRYFGFSQYLMNRGIDRTPVFASLSDTLNLMSFLSLTSPVPGTNVFDQYAVLVWSADVNTFAAVKSLLAMQGIPAAQINFVPIPVQLPLYMGYDAAADSFSLIMRTALPTTQASLDSYTADKPFYVVTVRPRNPPAISPAPIIGYASEVSGVLEDSSYTSALNSLLADIKSNYLRTLFFKNQRVRYGQQVGWDCINDGSSCVGDNHDALYSRDLTAPVAVTSLSDVVIVAGVNHRSTGKALYLNHSITDPVQSAGIVSVADPSLTTQSALYHAGVKFPNDARVKLYKNLYAYAISYDCGALKYCLNIPAPTAENPLGLPPGAAFTVLGRSYVDPHTRVRPAIAEIVQHQVLLGTRR